MVRQYDAQLMCDTKLKTIKTVKLVFNARTDANSPTELSLWEAGWRTTFVNKQEDNWIARCYHDMKRIVFNTFYLQASTMEETEQTTLHEIAHALCGPGKGHGPEWINKAVELGVIDPGPCRLITISRDKARSIEIDEKVEKEKPKRKFNRVNKACPICSLEAIEANSIVMNGIKWTRLKCNHLIKAEQLKEVEADYYGIKNITGSKTVYRYQGDGIKFLEMCNGRGLIADEPGLGKTAQAQIFAKLHKEIVCPVLWVSKATLKLQAAKEFLDWCGPEYMAQIIEKPRSFIMPGMRVYIISMDLLRNMPTEKLDSIGFKTVVVDEVQHFKNPDSTRTAELRKLVEKSEHFIALSGTPWKNRGQEYFPVLNMIDPIRFPSYAKFKNDWVDYQLDNKTGKYVQRGIKDVPKFREYTKDIIIRRMRDDVLPDLPKVKRDIRFIDMEEVYKAAYDKAEGNIANIVKAAIIDGKPWANIAGMIMELKHITGLAKVQVAIEDAVEFLDNTDDNQKLTIFHHHIDVGDNLQNGDGISYQGLDAWLTQNGYKKTLRLYGGRTAEERNRIIETFKNDPDCRVLIASTLASGEGLNIQFCQNAMMLERQWNPANEEQAELRFSRPLTWEDYPEYLQNHLFDSVTHQPKKVSIRVPYLIADGTIDSMLTEIVERKRLAFQQSMNPGMEGIKWEENEIIKELAELILKKRFKKVA